jgi:hypothetical protein
MVLFMLGRFVSARVGTALGTEPGARRAPDRLKPLVWLLPSGALDHAQAHLDLLQGDRVCKLRRLLVERLARDYADLWPTATAAEIVPTTSRSGTQLRSAANVGGLGIAPR